MSYGTIYALPFQSVKGVDYIVEIQKEDYTGRSIELKGSGDAPFSVELADEDFLYTPTRFSTATIRVVGNDYLQGLYSTGYQQYRVNFKQGSRVVWTGFITPELYTQNYTSTLFDLEIQCVSAMSALEYIKYKELGEKRAFVSLWDLLKKCVTESRGSYSSVYVPHVYAASAADYNTNANVLQTMTVSEQNFFDEDDEPMTLKEVLEESCKLLNWTCADWRGDLYFVDVDHKGDYRKYSADLGAFVSVLANTVKVQDIGFAGSDHTLDILGGYNKAIVRVSNYCVSQVLPEEDYENSKVINDVTLSNDDKRCRKLYLQPKNWNMHNGDVFGAKEMKYCIYKMIDGRPDIHDYTYTDVIEVKCRVVPDDIQIVDISSYDKIMSFKGKSSAYQSGAFCLSGSYKTISRYDNMTPWNNSRATWMRIAAFQLKIGNEYYGSNNGNPPFAWGTNAKAYVHIAAESGNNDYKSDYVSVSNTKTLEMPYTNVSGIIVPIDKMLSGELEFSLYAATMPKYADLVESFLFRDFGLRYVKEDFAEKTENNSDRYYENVVNESYVNPLDEIEFRISSYNNDGACYSKVMLGDNYLTDNLYSAIEGGTVRPEEHLIHRIVNQYGATKNKLTQVLVYSDSITPITTVTDKYQPDKRFAVTGGVIDFAAESFNCTIIQNGN